MADDNEELQIDEEPKGGKNKLVIIIAAVLLGIGAGALAVYFIMGSEPEAEETDAELEPQIIQSIYYKLEKPFIVNFMSKGKQRYLQIDVTFKGKDQAAMDAIKKHEPVVKNNLNQLFSSQQLSILQTNIGRQALATEATVIVQAFLQKEIGAPGIDQVLFTNFVMQ